MAQDKTIIRVQKNKENPYVMLNKTFIEDERLSWKAKGLMTYFLSKPDDWKIMMCDLVKRSVDGRVSVASGINELIKYGYIRRYQPKNDKNQYLPVEYIVYEIPQAGFLHAENPRSGNPHTGNQPQLNNNITKKRYTPNNDSHGMRKELDFRKYPQHEYSDEQFESLYEQIE
jgi:hypothetical protein